MSVNELPADGDWAAVNAAVHHAMKARRMSLAGLSRASGVSETTIRYLGRPEKRQRSTLVALSAALGYRHDYLVRVLAGAAHPGPHGRHESQFAQACRDVLDMLRSIDRKLDMLLPQDPREQSRGKHLGREQTP